MYTTIEGLEVETFTLGYKMVHRSAVSQRVYHLMKIDTGFFSYFYYKQRNICTREIPVFLDKNRIDNGKIQLPTKKLMYTVFYSN
jgi:hypothetical protein